MGGRPAAADRPAHHDGLSHRPTPAERRELPEHLENLESIGYTETPLKVDGADPLFTAAEAWLRKEGFLPPARARNRRAAFRLDEPLVVAQLENLRRLRQMRSTYGLASSAPDAVDGGESVWFERPNAVSGTRRVQLVFTAARDTARPAVHTRGCPTCCTSAPARTSPAAAASAAPR